MKIAMVILSVALALMVIASGAGKLRKSPQVMEMMKHVGVKDSQIPILAALEILGGLGLLIGLESKSLGRLSAILLAVYFAVAVISHLRVKDTFKAFAPAFFIFVIAIVTVWLQVKR